MGRFEDLIEQAKEGDTEALDALQSEFGGSTLREKAEKADDLEKKYQSALPHLRQARLDDLVAKLDDDLREVGLDIGDFGDFDPDDLSLETVQDKAKAKSENAQAAKLAVAKDAGFDSVEEYEEALATVKQAREQRRARMEDVAGGVASSGGEPPGTGQEETPYEMGKKAFAAAKEAGEADDVGMARGIEAILDAQSEPVEA